jgi:hypothetical protein
VPSGSLSNGRIQKFDLDGHYLSEFYTPFSYGNTRIAAYPNRSTGPNHDADTIFVGDGVNVWRIDSTPTASLGASNGVTLTGDAVTLNANAVAPFRAITKYEWDFDGDGTFDAETTTSAVSHAYASAGTFHPVVRATSIDALSATAATTVEVRPAPPPGEVGVSVNDGAQFTNDPKVSLAIVWPKFATGARFSNDGGFLHPTNVGLRSHIGWKLDSSGPERLPKTVYVRYSGPGIDETKTYTDDIILDQTPPTIASATAKSAQGIVLQQLAGPAKAKVRVYHLRVRATDNVSGVRTMQVTTDRAKPGAWKKYRTLTTFKTSQRIIWIRVRDWAGNASRWRSVAQRAPRKAPKKHR